MLLLASTGGLRYGDMIVQLIFFLIFLAIIIGVIYFFVSLKKRKNQMERLEKKVDRLLAEKDDGSSI